MNIYNIDKKNISSVSHSLKEKEYWRNTFSGGIEKVFFPHDLAGGMDDMAYHKFEIKEEVFNRILSLSKDSIPMIYMILVSNLKALIFKCLGENDISIGSPVEKQDDNKNLINTILPLRSKISNSLSYKELLLQVRKTIIDAIENQNYPFETLKNDLKSGYNSNGFNPIFDIAIYMDNLHEKTYLEGSESSMIFGFNKCENKIEATIDFNSSLYKKETIIKIGELYVQLMKQLLFNIEKPFNEISLLSTEEYNSLIFDWNKTVSSYSINTSIIDVFEEQVRKNNKETALSEDGKTLTYQELDELVNRFANSLKKRKIEKGTVVGILLDRSIDFIVSTLAVLKAECIFLPIDIASHEERIKFILEDSGCALLITNKDFNESKIYEGNKIIFDSKELESHEISAPSRTYSENETAYIIYTSGTTGKPKGTYVLHRGLTNYILWASKTYVQGEKLSFSLFTSVAFDLTITSIFTPLASGGTLYIYNSNETGNLIEEIVKENKVNVIKLTPSHLKLIRNYKLDENPNLKSVIKRFIVGGEQLETNISNEIFDKFHGKIEIFNEYGPTEATVGSMIYKFDKKDKGIAVPIGKPIANTQIYLLNRFQEPVPQGFQGEIFIAGSGLAGGYHKKPELTAAKFIDNPFVPGEKMYKTGDLGRINEDNNLEFIGRKDQQVKIRGFRVELGEIENRIQTHLNENFSESLISPDDYLQLNIEEQKRCTKCLLPENYEKITIGSDGVCSLCNEFESYKEKAFDYFKTLDDLDTLIQNSRKTSKSKYDCLLLFSGGKDSTYVLHRLVKMGLNILTFTYDNGYISKQAFENIEKITKKYNVDSLIIESENMKEVLCESLKTDHNVCNGCFKGVNTVGAKIANDYGINVVFTGLSRGQIFEIKLQGLFKLGIRDSDEIDEQLKIFRREYHSMNTKTSRLLNIKFEDSELDNIQFVDYFRYDDIKTRDVLNYLIKVDKSWDKPADTGTSSSNCMINDVGIYVHYKDKGYHFYADQSSWDCRLETISREEGIDELKGFTPNYNKIGEVLNELGYYQSSTSAIVVDKTDSTGDKVLCAYFVADKKVEISSLQKAIAAQLPDYMIPSYFMQIDKIPLTLSGKVNKDLLPEPKIVIETQYVAPTTPTQKKVTEIWSDVLDINIDEIGIHNNFFELGGHSLKATLLISEIEKRLFVKTPLIKIFENPTIVELANLVDQLEKKIYTALKKVEQKEYYSLSSAQKRLYFLQCLDLESTSYNIPLVVSWGEDVDINLLNATFNALIKRHESFRTYFVTVNEELVQKVQDEVSLKMDYFEANSKEEVKSLIDNYIQPFDLSKAPLLRSCIIKSDDGQYIWVVDMHHIISDGTSRTILNEDFLSMYRGNELKPLKFQYKDFSGWQNNLTESGEIESQEKYWLKQFSDENPRLQLPTDFKRPEVFNFEGDKYKFSLDAEDHKKLIELGDKNSATLYMNMLAILNILFYKYTGQTDIIIGSGIAGRSHSDLQNIVGMFINTLAMRNYPMGEKTYNEFLKEVILGSVQAFENQDIQFENLIDKLNVERDTSRNPLFDINMIVQNFRKINEGETGDEKLNEVMALNEIDSKLGHRNITSKFDMTFLVQEQKEGVHILLEYYTGIFKKETIVRLVSHLKNLIKSVIENPDAKLKELNIITEVEKEQLLYEFNDTKKDYPKDKTIHQLFEEQVEKTPNKTALTYLEDSITYVELNEKSNKLSWGLIDQGVQVGNAIGLHVEHSLEMVIGILGILKAGGCYLPIDKNYPEDRKKFVIADCGIKLILVDTLDFFKINGLKVLNLKDENSYSKRIINPPKKINPQSLAYIIYTSGSTGNPKGVPVCHRSVVNYISCAGKIYKKNNNLNFPLYSSLSFDLTVTSIFTPLLNGAIVKVYSLENNVSTIFNIIRDKDLGVLKLTPSHLDLISQEDLSDINIHSFVVGGEELYSSSASKIDSKITIYNEYGPTESTVGCIVYKYDSLKDKQNSVPIGRGLDNYNIYILDKLQNLVPIGVSGELCISGEGLAEGYINNPELTSEKFIDHPYKKGERLYKTGDLARWLPDGNVEFLGRIDHQVKIRGFRIELGEIESALIRHEYVKESVVLAREEKGDKYLCAYLVTDEEFNQEEIHTYLSSSLPDYMVPSYFVELDELPLTANGKVNRKALPSPKVKAGDDYVAPSNETEEKLVGIWSEVLNIEKEEISTIANFFTIGGHSLKATLLTGKIHKELGVEFPLGDVFIHSSIKAQASQIEISIKKDFISVPKANQQDYYPLSSAQKRLYLLKQMDLSSSVYNMFSVISLGAEPDKLKIEEVFQKLILRHESFRTSFELQGEEPVQRIHERVGFKIKEYSIGKTEVQGIKNQFIQAFDLSQAPLLRAAIVEIKGEGSLLLTDMHHIISDGTSQAVLEKEFLALYSGEELSPLKLQYKDYSEWQRSEEHQSRVKEQETYWVKEFEGEIPVLNLPTDYIRPVIKSNEGATVSFYLNEKDTKSLIKIAKENDTTMFMLFLSIFNVFLSKLSGQEDVTIGTGVACRRHPDLQMVIGMFVNMLALRSFPEGRKPFDEFLKEVRDSTILAFENQDYQFDDLVVILKANRDASRNPLFDVILNSQNQSQINSSLYNYTEELIYGELKKARFDMNLTYLELEKNFFIKINYSTALFNRDTIKMYVNYLKEIISNIINLPNKKLEDIKIVHEYEEFNNNATFDDGFNI